MDALEFNLFDFPIETPEERYLKMLTDRPPLPYTPDLEKPHYFFLFNKSRDIIITDEKIARAIKAILNPLKYNVIFFKNLRVENPCKYPRDSQICLLSGHYYIPATSPKIMQHSRFLLTPWVPLYYHSLSDSRYADICCGYGVHPESTNLFKEFVLSLDAPIREGTYYLEGGQVFIHPTLNMAFVGILSIALNMAQLFKESDESPEDLLYGPISKYVHEIMSNFLIPPGPLFGFCMEKKLKLIYEGIADELGVKSICVISCQDDFHLDMTLNLTPRGVIINSPALTLQVITDAFRKNLSLKPYYDRAVLAHTLLQEEHRRCVEKLRTQGIEVLEVPGVATATLPRGSTDTSPYDAVNFMNGLLLPDGTYITGDIPEDSPLHIMKLKFAEVYTKAFPSSPLHFIHQEGMSTMLKTEFAGIHCITATSFPS